MKLHVIQHVPFEDSAAIEIWARKENLSLTKSLLFQNNSFPKLIEFDALIVMGGPMNIYENEKFPWLASEKRFIEQAIQKRKFVLGICLGAQLIADVLGAPVSKNKQKEIGWHEVHLTEHSKQSNLFRNLPKKFMAFHWHGDTFDIPKGAIHLAESSACANQAFEFEGRVLGLQFHLESTEESVEKLIENCGDELVCAPFIQSQDEIRDGYQQLNTINKFMNQILNSAITQIPREETRQSKNLV